MPLLPPLLARGASLQQTAVAAAFAAAFAAAVAAAAVAVMLGRDPFD